MIDQQTSKNEGTHIEFQEGLFVRVPDRDDVEVVRKGYGSPEERGFTVIRPLVNFCINDPNLEPEEDFSGPLQLLIRYTQHDLNLAADKGGKLVFAYFTEADGWIRLDPDDDKVEGTRHQFFDGFGGYVEIILDSWPADPSNAWGV